MSVWTEFEGSISFHDSEHISVKKVFDECFNGREVLGDVEMKKGGNFLYFEIWCNIEESLEDALILFNKFTEALEQKCTYPKLLKFDISVKGRMLK